MWVGGEFYMELWFQSKFNFSMKVVDEEFMLWNEPRMLIVREMMSGNTKWQLFQKQSHFRCDEVVEIYNTWINGSNAWLTFP